MVRCMAHVSGTRCELEVGHKQLHEYTDAAPPGSPYLFVRVLWDDERKLP